jgi:hypothetical protein
MKEVRVQACSEQADVREDEGERKARSMGLGAGNYRKRLCYCP